MKVTSEDMKRKVAQPVDFLVLIGQPETIKATKENIRTLIDIVFPHYCHVFEQWWEESEPGNFEFWSFNEELDDEDSTYEGEQVYEYLLADFGSFVIGNA